MVIGIILFVCVMQLLGFRHAALFLKKEIFKEDPTKTFERLERIALIPIKFPMSSTKREETIALLKETQKSGLYTQYQSLPSLILGFSLFIAGPLIGFDVSIPFVPTMSHWFGLLAFLLGIFFIGIGLRSAFPGMLKEFSAESAITQLSKNKTR